MAFVLGELIAVLKIDLFLSLITVATALIVIIILQVKVGIQLYKNIKWGTRITCSLCLFFAVLIGFVLTCNEEQIRDKFYAASETQSEITGAVGKVEQTEYGTNYFLENVEVKINNKGNTYEILKCDSILVTLKNETQINVGNTVKVSGKLTRFKESRNFGNFDLQNYYMSIGIYRKVEADKIEVLDNNIDYVRQNLREARIEVERIVSQICNDENKGIFSLCSEKNAGIFQAVLLGNKTELDLETKTLYQINGISHLLAISGLHVSFIGMFIYSALRKIMKFTPAACVSVLVVIMFGLMIGMSMSTVRAVVMFGLRLLSEITGRNYDALTAMSLSAIFLLCDNPFAIYNSGFQMSYSAVVAIIIIWPKISNFLGFRNKILNSMLFCLSINMIMTPIIAWNYFELPSYSFILNIVVVPLMSFVILSGIAGIGGALINTFAARVLILPGCIILEVYEILCKLLLSMPFSNVITGKPTVIRIGLYYLILVLTLIVFDIWIIHERERNKEKEIPEEGMLIETLIEKARRIKRYKIIKTCAFSISMIMMMCLMYIYNYNHFQISFLDVGQGDGIFIRADNGTVVTVDGGSTSEKEVGKYKIIPFLKASGVKQVDYAIMTHADEDHVSGLKELLRQSCSGVIVKNLVLPNTNLKDDAYLEMIRIAQENDVNVLHILQGDVLKLVNVYIKCLHPGKDFTTNEHNNYSTVLSVEYKQFNALLAGDISIEEEKYFWNMLNNKYTILKVAHHGSKYSTSDEFLKLINPIYSVISVGKDNMYGHPAKETLERLEKIESKILTTSGTGEVTIFIDGDKMAGKWK